MWSNVLVTDNYALIAKNRQDQPFIYKLSYDPVTLEAVTFPKVDNWTSEYFASLTDLHNGDIVYAQDRNVLILDNETLEVKQIFGVGIPYSFKIQMFTYFDPVMNESNYIIGTGSISMIYSELKKDKITGKYSTEYRFSDVGSYYYPFKLEVTGVDSGVVYRGVYL
jgi:hypothetical protein